MIQNAWYAACWSHEVDFVPKRLTVNHQDVVLVRNHEGQVHAFHAYCPHRGCDLSLGVFDGNLLTCPFHGWRFQPDGQCVHIPANQTQTFFPAASRLRRYQVEEKFGVIWINFTSNRAFEVASFTSFPEMEDGDWVRIPFRKRWKAHFTRAVESVLDVSHLPFVHPETTGKDVDPVVNALEVVRTPEGLCIFPSPYVAAHPMEPPMTVSNNEGERTVIELRFPNQWTIRTPFGGGKWMSTYLTFTPVNDQETEIYGFVMRNFDPESEFLNLFHMEHTDFVLSQDQRIIESIRPFQAPLELKQEAHVPSDKPTIQFRLMLREALQRE